MRDTALDIAATPIGALELKQAYQRNMFLAMMIAAGSMLLIMLVAQWYISILPAPVRQSPPRLLPPVRWMPPPPPMIGRPAIGMARPEVNPLGIGVPIPVPDEDVTGDIDFATKDDLAHFNAGIAADGALGDENATYVIAPDVGDILPGPREFVAVDELPVLVVETIPEYPEIAEHAGIEGSVWVRVLVGKDGRVLEAIIDKASGTSAGFEEAALAAAKSNRFKPAIQNGRSVPVWVSYKVVFQLK